VKIRLERQLLLGQMAFLALEPQLARQGST
jgi:hypothetical protein